jgi:PadR family transcriptional regulator, regulatory protein PadR
MGADFVDATESISLPGHIQASDPVAPGRIQPVPVAFQKENVSCFCWLPKGTKAMNQKTDVKQGTLPLMVLKTLEVLGTLHGYGIARRIEQISGDLLSVNQGTLYPLLLKLEQEGSIDSDWGASENNRRARYYRLTRAGRRHLQSEVQEWQQTTEIMTRFLTAKAEELP